MAEEITKVQNVSAATKNAIARKSVQTLPNDPSARGYSAEELKRRFYQPVLDAANSALAEIDRVVNEMNVAFSQVGTFIDGAELKAPFKLDLNTSTWTLIGDSQYERIITQADHGIVDVEEIAVDMHLVNPEGRLVNVNNYEIYASGTVRLYNDNPGGGFVTIRRNRDGFVRGDFITDVDNVTGIAKVAKSNLYSDLDGLPDFLGAAHNEEVIANIINGTQKVGKAKNADRAAESDYATNAGTAGTAGTAATATRATQDGMGNNIANTYAKQDGTYMDLAVGSVIGTIGEEVSAVTQDQSDNSNKVATTSYVRQAVSAGAVMKLKYVHQVYVKAMYLTTSLFLLSVTFINESQSEIKTLSSLRTGLIAAGHSNLTVDKYAPASGGSSATPNVAGVRVAAESVEEGYFSLSLYGTSPHPFKVPFLSLSVDEIQDKVTPIYTK